MNRLCNWLAAIQSVMFLIAALSAPVSAGTRSIAGTAVDDRIINAWQEDFNSIRNEIQAARAPQALAKRAATESNALDRQSLIWDSDRDPLDVVLRRTEALLNDLSRMPKAPDLRALVKRLNEIKQRAGASVSSGLRKTASVSAAQRDSLFLEVSGLRRRAALSNPLLDFDSILFIQNASGYSGLIHNAAWTNWECDGGDPISARKWTAADWKTYNFADPGTESSAGGTKITGLCVLSKYKTTAPVVTPLFQNSTLENGRHQGQVLAAIPGLYNHWFDLSYDGKQVVFAKRLRDKYGAYHIFMANLDGTGLRQVTDGFFPDYEPAFLPNGRIVFSSLRRWIITRCASCNVQACATLFSVKPDGSDLYPISWHETSELLPSVNNDGILVYTRWDYVDRDFSAAHHIWTSLPDGRDPRAPHGNYPYPWSTQNLGPNDTAHDGRGDRPWAEFQIRAIPNTSGKYVAIAGVHHGMTPGVPILINTAIADDNKMSQVKIIKGTCLPAEQPQGRGCPDALYHNPWPLSEDYYLMSRRDWDGEHIVLMDKFGNVELVYGGSSAIACMPFRPRTKPPVLATATWQGERRNAPDHYRGVVSIMNVYETDQPFPAGTKIKAIRVLQIVPLPWCGSPNAVCSYQGLNRMILGTVPVENDGSAYFEAPVERELMFQALDSNGMAVQSMRSGTYVHPGEHLSCMGCHEDKWKAIPPVNPTAIRRAPSKITPDVSGTCPINFGKLGISTLVQGKCVPCHQQKGVKPFNPTSGNMEWDLEVCFDGSGWFNGLLPKKGGYRTIPGEFGAKLRLGKIVASHVGSRVTRDELHRIVVWLDANSNKSSAYGNATQGTSDWPLMETDSTNPTGVENDRPVRGANTIVADLRRRGFLAPGASKFDFRVDGARLTIENPASGPVFITAFDASGRRTYARVLAAGQPAAALDLRSCLGRPGSYIVRATNGREVKTKSVSIAR